MTNITISRGDSYISIEASPGEFGTQDMIYLWRAVGSDGPATAGPVNTAAIVAIEQALSCLMKAIDVSPLDGDGWRRVIRDYYVPLADAIERAKRAQTSED